MTMENEGRNRSRRRGNRAKEAAPTPKRDVNYRQLRNPFPMMNVFSDEQAEDMHQSALNILEDMGMRVLLPEARKIFAAAGAKVEGEMVFIGRDIIEAAVASAPKSIHCRAGAAHRDLQLELGSLVFQAGAGAPHATDPERGRRPG